MDINKDKIDEILTRGVENIYPSKEALERVLKSDKKIRLYYGIDPTSETLHLGHLVQLLKLRKFQDLGHEVIILIGDFTAQIGDPTDKQAARKPLTHQQVLKNAKGYKKQIGKILDLTKANVRFVHNEKWTNKLKPVDMLELSSHFTASQLLNRNMFQERMKAGREIYVHEFLYPIFQAYDAVTMDVDLQIGGNDQMFNMLAGRDLMKKKKNKEMFVLTTKLLEDSSGKKMGKTEGNMITLNDSANDMFGKIMSWSDNMIVLGFEICTDIEMNDIKKIAKENPRDAKMRLAYEIVKIYHGEKEAEKAQENFVKLFQKKEIPDEIKEIKINAGETIGNVLVNNKIVSSNSEFRRLIKSGAIDVNGQVVEDVNYSVEQPVVVRVGKKKFLRILI